MVFNLKNPININLKMLYKRESFLQARLQILKYMSLRNAMQIIILA